jgi:lipopolysaccharide/colanic/teichoic acid biosynthesis glycosyltransferase
MLTKSQQAIKRSFDIVVSVVVLPVLIIPLIFLWILATLSTGRNGLFIQQRIGRHGKKFGLLKLRSLQGSDHVDINKIKASETSFGTWIRKNRMDELPQFINVLVGDMSLVGPRPDIPGYADMLKGEDRFILKIRPGITGPATLKYRNEDELLLQQPDPKQYNDEVIWPDKVKINKEYIANWSLGKDVQYLWHSVFG